MLEMTNHEDNSSRRTIFFAAFITWIENENSFVIGYLTSSIYRTLGTRINALVIIPTCKDIRATPVCYAVNSSCNN